MITPEYLRSRTVEASHGKTISLGELIDGWEAHIARLHRESNVPASEPTFWGFHDYVAALYLRDLLELAVKRLSADDAMVVNGLLTPTDQLLRSFTEVDPERRVLRILGESGSHAWWWELLPKSGPVLSEVVEVFGRL
jgi:hypothetical protein